MGGLSLWHWIVILLVVAIPIAIVCWTAKRTTGPDGPIGIGGWLLLVVIGQTLSPLRTLVEMGKEMPNYSAVMALPNGQIAVYGEVILNLVYASLQIATTVVMYRKSRLYPRLFIYQWLATLAVIVIDTAFVSVTLHVEFFRNFPWSSFVPALISGVWVMYMVDSVRVKNTFTR